MKEKDVLIEGTKNLFINFFDKDNNKKERANMWTFSRLILPFLILISSSKSFSSNDEKMKKIYLGCSAFLTGFAAFTDYIDGKSARKHNIESEYGKLLDAVADKVFAFVLGLNLTNLDPKYLRVVIGEMLIGAVNLYYKGKDKDLNITSTKIGKIKEWPLFITLGCGYASSINDKFEPVKKGLIATTNVLQALTIHSYIKQNKELIKEKSL